MAGGVWVPVNAQMKGFVATVIKEASGAAKKSGKAFEDEFSRAGEKAGQSLAKKVEQATNTLARARSQEAQAAKNLAVAEQELETLRSKGNASTSQLIAAENKVETARANTEDAAMRVARSEKDLEAARNGQSTTANSVKRAEDQLSQARIDSTNAAGKVKAAEAAVDEAREQVKSSAAAVSAAEQKLIDTRDRYGAGTKQTAAAERELAKAKKASDSANLQAVKAEGDLGKARTQLQNSTDKLKAKELLHKQSLRDVAAAQKQAGQATRQFGDEASKAGSKLGNFSSVISGAVGGAVASLTSSMMNALGSLAREAIVASDATDKFKSTLNFAGVDAGTIESLTKQTRAYADATVYELADIQNMTAQLASNGVKDYANLAEAAGNLNAVAGGNADTFKSVGMVMAQTAGQGKLTTENWNQLADAIPGASGRIQEALQQAGAFTGNFRDAMSKGEITAEEFNAAVMKIGSEPIAVEAAQSTQTFEGMLGNLQAAIVGGFADALNGLKPQIGVIINGFTSLATTVIPPLVAGFVGITSAVVRVGQLIAPLAPVIKVTAAAMAVLTAASVAYTAAQKVQTMGGMAAAFSKMATSIKATSVATKAATAAQWLFNSAIWANPITWVVAAIAAVVAALVLFFTKTETGRKAWQRLTEFMKAAWEKATSAIKNAYTTYIAPMVDALKAKFNEMKQALQPAIDAIKAAWDGFKNKVVEFVQRWWDPVIKPALIALAAIIFGPVLMAIGAVVAIVGVVVAAIGGLAYVVMSIPGWVQAAVQGAKQWFMDLWQSVTDWFTQLGATISNWWAEHIAPLPDRVGQAISVVKQWFMDLWQNVVNWFQDMIRTVQEWWQNHIATLPQKVAEAVRGVLDNLRKLPDNIRSLFAAAGEWLVSAGRNIINGLWNGMKNAWGSVKSWLSSHLSFSAIGSLIGLSGGGVVAYANGGISRAYVDGGIGQLEAYANGGGRENHVAQIAPAGSWRVWAEPETGGEAYIPLARSKRTRSTAILDNVAARFGYRLVDERTGEGYDRNYRGDLGPQHVAQFADGAVVTDDDLRRFVEGEGASRSLEGAPYVWGGSNWGDCSGTQSSIAARAVGLDPFPRKFATGSEASWLSAHGFQRGHGGPGDLRIGFKDGGPAGGHTAGTLPDGTNVEMGGGRGNGQIGGGAAGADDSYFNEFFYLTMQPKFEDVQLADLDELPPEAGGSTAAGSNVTVTDDATNPVDYSEAQNPDTGSGETTISGAAGDLVKEVVSGHVADILGVFGVPDKLPSWLTAARDAYKQNTKDADNPGTSVAEQHAIDQHDEAVTTMTPQEIKADPQLRGMGEMDTIKEPKVPEWGPEFFAYEISRRARDMDLGADGAKIGVATALVESGDPMKMYANNQVPESLNYNHDAVGSDHDSVGLFQQRDNGAWGTVKERMTPYDSAGMFFRELVKFDWKSMDPGAAAQKVQRSAFPDRYATKMDRAKEMVAGTSLFKADGTSAAKKQATTATAQPEEVEAQLYDQGGILDHKKLALNLSGKPEAVLTNDELKDLRESADTAKAANEASTEAKREGLTAPAESVKTSAPEIVGALVSSGVKAGSGLALSGVKAGAGMLSSVPGVGGFADAGVGVLDAVADPLTDIAAWYTGEVASRWTDAFITFGEQGIGAIREPIDDALGPLSSAVNSVSTNVQDVPVGGGAASGGAGGDGCMERGPATVINVQSVAEALEAQRHLERRELAGFGARR